MDRQLQCDQPLLRWRFPLPLAILAFNSLLCLTDPDDQGRALQAIAGHLADDGLLVLDIVNPLQLEIQGNPVPRPFFTRRNPHTGQPYTRFAASDPFDENHCQRLHGWYDEVNDEGFVARRPYSVTWRPIFRFEAEMMHEKRLEFSASVEPPPFGGVESG